MLEDIKWFYGIIENVDDPQKSGLVQVRGIGIHELNEAILPSEFLPWCKVMTPATSSSVKGVGVTPTGIQKGSMALCIAMDEAYTDNRILFTWQAGDMNTNDITELARGLTNEIIRKKLDERNESKRTGFKWAEPQTNYGNVVYPYNQVTVSRAGHVIELDDTPNLERIHILHKDGSFIEYMPGGDVVEKSMGNRYEIYRRNLNRLINGKDRKNAADVAVHHYSKTYHFNSAEQATFTSDTDMLFVAPSTIEFHTALLQIIGSAKISQTLYVDEIKAARISCDSLDVASPINGTAKFAQAAAQAGRLGGGAPAMGSSVQPLNIRAQLKNSTGTEGDNNDAPAGSNKADEKVSQEPASKQKSQTSANTSGSGSQTSGGSTGDQTSTTPGTPSESIDQVVGKENIDEWYRSQIPNIPKYRYNHITIHTTATPLSQFHDVHTIRQMHKAQGWSDIGYHVLITRTGLIQIGRPWNVMGAHVKGFNEHNFAVVLVGGVKLSNGRWVGDNNFTQAQWKSLQIVITDVARLYDVPVTNILGHRDWSPDANSDGVLEKHEWIKECPCFDVRSWVASWWDTRTVYRPKMPSGKTETIDTTEPSNKPVVTTPDENTEQSSTTAAKFAEVLPATEISNVVKDLSERRVQDIATNIARGILSSDVSMVAANVAALAAADVRNDTGPMVDKAVTAFEKSEAVQKKVEEDLTYFKNQYYGPSSFTPAKRPDGTDPHPGDLYFNTIQDKVMVYVTRTDFIGWTPIDGGGKTWATQIQFDNSGTDLGSQNVGAAIKELHKLFKLYEPVEGPSQTGDGLKRRFNSPISRKVDDKLIWVFVDGRRMKPTREYQIETDGKILLTDAPANGLKIESLYFNPLQGVLPLTGGTLVGRLNGTTLHMTGKCYIKELEVENVTLIENSLHSSDRTLKRNIRRIKKPLSKIQRIDGVSFKWKESDNDGHGTIAQQLQQVMPSAVKRHKGKLRVDYHALIALCIESIKALIYRVERLEQQGQRIKELEKRIEQMEKLINENQR